MSGNTTARVVEPVALTKNRLTRIIRRVLATSEADEKMAYNLYGLAFSVSRHSST